MNVVAKVMDITTAYNEETRNNHVLWKSTQSQVMHSPFILLMLVISLRNYVGVNWYEFALLSSPAPALRFGGLKQNWNGGLTVEKK